MWIEKYTTVFNFLCTTCYNSEIENTKSRRDYLLLNYEFKIEKLLTGLNSNVMFYNQLHDCTTLSTDVR